VIIISAALVSLAASQANSLRISSPNAQSVQVAPLFSEEVLFSKIPAKAVLARPDAGLTLLEDSGAVLANTQVKLNRRASAESGIPEAKELVSKLRSTESRFTGIGLEGAAKVNGKPFSWANVNLSNISYG
jgi:hypothetical protein